MFDIYAGANDISTLNSSSNVIKLSVSKVIQVNIFYFIYKFKIILC